MSPKSKYALPLSWELALEDRYIRTFVNFRQVYRTYYDFPREDGSLGFSKSLNLAKIR